MKKFIIVIGDKIVWSGEGVENALTNLKVIRETQSEFAELFEKWNY